MVKIMKIRTLNHVAGISNLIGIGAVIAISYYRNNPDIVNALAAIACLGFMMNMITSRFINSFSVKLNTSENVERSYLTVIRKKVLNDELVDEALIKASLRTTKQAESDYETFHEMRRPEVALGTIAKSKAI